MHGVKRQPKTAASQQARAARKAKEAARLSSYLEVESHFFTLKKGQQKDQEALEHTTTLLTLNPELYTVWNYRRETLLHLFATAPPLEAEIDQKKQDVFASLRSTKDSVEPISADQRIADLLEMDLELTEHALRAHPKVYWIWNHRMWCLTQYPVLPQRQADWVWERELKLVERMLDLDPRNFHGWDCRRAIVSQLAIVYASASADASKDVFPTVLSGAHLDSEVRSKLVQLAERELAYSLRKIEANFSNFSAWHQRTKLLPHLWAAKGLDEAERGNQIDKELELVQHAMYTDPSDQSVWIYHAWLISMLPDGEHRTNVLTAEIAQVEELFELEPDSKWCAHTLAHYKTLLLQSQTQSAEFTIALQTQVTALLRQLMQLDPDRSARYQDLLDGKAQF